MSTNHFDAGVVPIPDERGPEDHPVHPPQRLPARLLARLNWIAVAILLPLYLMAFVALVNGRGGLETYARSSDLMPTIAAAKMIAQGQGRDLYHLDAQRQMQEAVMQPYMTLLPGEMLPFNHLPWEAFLLVPLLSKSYVVVLLVWTLLTVCALYAALLLLQRAVPLHRAAFILALVGVISYMPVFRTLLLGQSSPLVLLGICLTYVMCRASAAEIRGREGWIGIGLALVALKPQVAPLVALLVLLAGRWRALIWFGALIGSLAVAVMPVLGVTWPLTYARLLLAVSAWQKTAAINPAIMHNWRGFVHNTIGMVSPGAEGVAIVILTVLSLAFLGVA